ncbi:MAG: ABC transporter ATP-binding protein [Bergeyella zoohelcum]|nr:ABC transporter ATP-binding protein [Bergeyella zoohelcum]
MFVLEQINISYSKNKIIKHIDLQVHKGEVIGVLGKNGAGKTTLFNAIYQNIPYNGKILYQNKPINRKNISFLEAENYFYPYMTGREYLSFFGIEKNLENNIELIEKLQIPLDKFIHNYSTGMKKKIAILAILLMNKDIVILDEPFNGVDYESVNIIYEIIRNLKNSNKIILLSSHIIETLFNTCDKIIVLENGEITKTIPKTEFENLKKATFI